MGGGGGVGGWFSCVFVRFCKGGWVFVSVFCRLCVRF